MNRLLPVVLIAALAVALGALVFYTGPDQKSEEPLKIAAAPTGGDFVLQSADGPVALDALRGKVVVLYFGYTWCPDVCPTNLGYLSAALSEMTEQELAQVRPVFISVDPERDTPDRLKSYVAYFHSAIVGVTGDRQSLDAVARAYGAAYQIVKKPGEENYVVDHSATTYVLDKEGKLHKGLPHGTSPEEVLAELRFLIGSAE